MDAAQRRKTVKAVAGAIEIGATHDVRRRHLDLGRDRSCPHALSAGAVQGRAPRHRRVRRRLQQPRPPGDAGARDEAVDAGVVINGLPILAFEPFLDQYFRDYVIGGPGAFMIVAKDFETFADAILKKMIIEIAGVPPPRRHAGATFGHGETAGRYR